MLEAEWDPVAGKVVFRETEHHHQQATMDGEGGAAPTAAAAAAAAPPPPILREDEEEEDAGGEPQQPQQQGAASAPGGAAAAAATNSKTRTKAKKNYRPRRDGGGDEDGAWEDEAATAAATRKENALPWREESGTTASTTQQQQQRRRSRSRGLPPSHPAANSNNNSSHSFVAALRQDIRERVVRRTTARARREQECQRQAFRQVTAHRTHPRQERALRHCRKLRRAWGAPVDGGDDDELDGDEEEQAAAAAAPRGATAGVVGEPPSGDEVAASNPQPSGSDAASSSAASSLDVPEAKRCLRERSQSPAQSRHVQQCRREFLRQQAVPPGQDPTTAADGKIFGPALFCMEPRVVGVESATTGRRRYGAAQLGRFFDQYWRRTEPAARHAYELIRPRTPCRLYLDLECTAAENPELGRCAALQEQLLAELFHELAAEIREQLAGEMERSGDNNDNSRNQSSPVSSYRLLPLERRHIVDLDSSTDQKFSRHWIVHVPCVDLRSGTETEALFPDAAAVGLFVRNFVGRLADRQATGAWLRDGDSDDSAGRRPALARHLFFVRTASQSRSGGTSCLVDLGVYTRNRLFRLLGSHKFGKPAAAALRIAASNEFPLPIGNDAFYVPDMVMAAVRDDDGDDTAAAHCSQEDVDDKVTKSVARTDWTPHAEALAQTLVVPLNGAKIAYPIMPCTALKAAAAAAASSKSSGGGRLTTAMGAPSLCYGNSPYPMIDDFVLRELATRGEVPGSIRAWSIEYERIPNGNSHQRPARISYQMSRNRWCECVGRAHKSNNIAWHVDLRDERPHCYQTCHDPDCRAANFRGAPVPLPAATAAALRDALFEQELAHLDLANLTAPATATAASHNNSNPQHHQKQQSVDEFDDDDAEFEDALAVLNLDQLTTRVNYAAPKDRDDAAAIAEAKKAPLRPESSAQRLARLYSSTNCGANMGDDNADNSFGGMNRKPIPFRVSHDGSSVQSRHSRSLSDDDDEVDNQASATGKAPKQLTRAQIDAFLGDSDDDDDDCDADEDNDGKLVRARNHRTNIFSQKHSPPKHKASLMDATEKKGPSSRPPKAELTALLADSDDDSDGRNSPGSASRKSLQKAKPSRTRCSPDKQTDTVKHSRSASARQSPSKRSPKKLSKAELTALLGDSTDDDDSIQTSSRQNQRRNSRIGSPSAKQEDTRRVDKLPAAGACGFSTRKKSPQKLSKEELTALLGDSDSSSEDGKSRFASNRNPACARKRSPSKLSPAKVSHKSPAVSKNSQKALTQAELNALLGISSDESDGDNDHSTTKLCRRTDLRNTSKYGRTPSRQPQHRREDDGSDCENRDTNNAVVSASLSFAADGDEDEFPLGSPQVLCDNVFDSKLGGRTTEQAPLSSRKNPRQPRRRRPALFDSDDDSSS